MKTNRNKFNKLSNIRLIALSLVMLTIVAGKSVYAQTATPTATATATVSTITTPIVDTSIKLLRLRNPNGNDNLSPGSIAILTGQNLTIGGTKKADGSLCSVDGVPNAQGFYPNELCSTSVRIGGKVAPLVSVSATSIKLQIPYSVVPNRKRQSVIVISGENANSKAFSITRTTSPSFFRVDGKIIESEYVEGNSTPVSVKDATKVIPAGSTLTVFGTGFGNATTPLSTGQVSPKDAKQATAPQFNLVANTFKVVNGRTRSGRTTISINPTAYGLVANQLAVHFATFKVPENVSGGRATLKLVTSTRSRSASGNLTLGQGKAPTVTQTATPTATK